MAKNKSVGWSNLQMVGLVIVAFGAAFFAYSMYNFMVIPHVGANPYASTTLSKNCHVVNGATICSSGSAQIGPGNGSVTQNATGSLGNREVFAGSPASFSIVRIGDVLSGVLMVLLGIMTFKYGELRKLSGEKKFRS